jgi:hypothetical protein
MAAAKSLIKVLLFIGKIHGLHLKQSPASSAFVREKRLWFQDKQIRPRKTEVPS